MLRADLNLAKRLAERYEVMQQVIARLEWDEDTYAWYQYEMGNDYLDQYFEGDPESAELLKGEKLFWSWWKNLWHERNENFLYATQDLPYQQMMRHWELLNAPYILTQELKIPRLVTSKINSPWQISKIKHNAIGK